MKILKSSIVYENPLPQLKSRQSFFPNVAECENGELVAVFAIGEAFESVDSTSYISRSSDGGNTWGAPVRILSSEQFDTPITDYCKITRINGSTLGIIGYAYIRSNPELPIGNPENGGILDDFVFFTISFDNGNTWAPIKKIDCAWGPHVEASANITVLQDGSFITPITGFPDWQGQSHGKMCGRALRSTDNGLTWNDDTVCMEFEGNAVTCYEQRMCQLESGTIINIGWNEDTVTGERLYNHYTASFDNGKSFTAPKSTGVRGQASSVMSLGGERLLALHAVRRDTDRPGIYGYIVDFSNKEWNIVDSMLLWEPNVPILKDDKMAEIFSFLKFGQPSAILLSDGNILMSHWYAENGVYRVITTRIEL